MWTMWTMWTISTSFPNRRFAGRRSKWRRQNEVLCCSSKIVFVFVCMSHTHTYKSCSIQYLPVSRSQMLVELSTFAATVYNTRPVGWSEATKFNSGGTGFMHQFYMWTLVRHLNPKHIIESGSYNGLGTSILRKAAPEAQITVVSPRTPHVYVDKHNKSRYFTEDSFCDFSTIDWNNAKHLILQVPTLPCL